MTCIAWPRIRGGFNRYVPAFAYECDFRLFLDDDMFPGIRVVEHFVRHASERADTGLLGQIGRRITEKSTGALVR